MAKPKLALIPAAQGSKLFSVLPSSGVGDFNFTRSSSATRINSQGLIETVASGVSRLNYPMIDGKVVGCPHHILENSATNLVTYSEDFSDSYWTKVNSNVTSGFPSPDGGLNACKLTEDGINSYHIFYNTGFIASNGESHTYSLFVKYNGRQWFALVGQYGNTTRSAFFDIQNGLLGYKDSGVTSKIEDYGNGWYRISATAVMDGDYGRYRGYLAEADNDTVYQGDGTSGVYIWGAQFEQLPYASSYIPTNGSAVTRSAETANGSGDAATFNDSEGVLMAEISALADDSTFRAISISDASYSNRCVLRYGGASNRTNVLVVSSGSTVFDNNSTSLNILNYNKIVLKYKQNDFSFWINGFEVATDTSGNTPSGLSQLQFADSVNSGTFFYGNTKQLQYYNSALTDSELETLTSWVSFSDMAEGQLYSVE